ncbi:MAG: hypothetical protein R3266_02080, partial [Gemmatimonadota bacterium]|nr:hypothetical protein [Gemmatimonadota bacterium]
GWRRERRALLLVAAPILLALLASALGLYPFRGRLILFLVPSTLILIGWGIEAGLVRARTLRVAALAAGLVWLAGAGTACLAWLGSPHREELRPVLEAVSSRLEPGDVVYLHSGAQHAQLFYERTCPACSLETATVVRGAFLAGDPEAIQAEAEGLPRTGRLWALFAHEWWGYGDTERDALVALLRQRATRVETLEAPGAEAYLFDLAGPGEGSEGSTP